MYLMSWRLGSDVSPTALIRQCCLKCFCYCVFGLRTQCGSSEAHAWLHFCTVSFHLA